MEAGGSSNEEATIVKITKNMNGTSLNIARESRLDTIAAPEMEQAVKESMDSANEWTLDFSRLD